MYTYRGEKNKEGYRDPTAEIAVALVARREKKKRKERKEKQERRGL